MKRVNVSSSNLATVGYDESSFTLEITFHNGGVYEYYNVPKTTYSGLVSAASHGSFFHRHIKDVYGYRKIG